MLFFFMFLGVCECFGFGDSPDSFSASSQTVPPRSRAEAPIPYGGISAARWNLLFLTNIHMPPFSNRGHLGQPLAGRKHRAGKQKRRGGEEEFIQITQTFISSAARQPQR
jgi:hypothetical protein